MKILHIIGSMDPVSGGPCQGIRNSNPEMVRLGSSREVVCLDDPAASFLGMDDFPVHALGPAKTIWQYSPKLMPWLIDNCDRFDVIIINGIWIYSSYIGWKIMKVLKSRNDGERNVRLFVMPHGMLDPYFQQASNRRFKAIRNWIYWKIIEGKVVNEADGVLFTCETELQLARKSFRPYHPKREINVGYGIMPPPAQTKRMAESFAEKCPEVSNQPYLLFLSRIHEKKGVDLLITSYATLALRAQFEGKQIPKLVIAGPGLDTEYGKKMRRLAKSYADVKDWILFPGMLTGDAKWGALYGCEAFILPSHQENFGIAIVEAMACSKAVLISDQINIWLEAEANGGAIVAPDTLQGTKAMLKYWLDLSLNERSEMGQRAYTTFQQHFHINASSAFFLKSISSNINL